VGRKYVRLYAPSETEKLAPYEEPLLCNTSRIDVEQPNLQQHPAFADAEAMVECVAGNEW
jgi:hypothetical protein